jgi:hypothetical protein
VDISICSKNGRRRNMGLKASCTSVITGNAASQFTRMALYQGGRGGQAHRGYILRVAADCAGV